MQYYDYKYTCKLCDYDTDKQYNFTRHVNSSKHLKKIEYIWKNDFITKEYNAYRCICGVEYKQKKRCEKHICNCPIFLNKYKFYNNNNACEVCGKIYKYKKNLEQHQNMCKKYAKKIEKHNRSKDTTIRGNVCVDDIITSTKNTIDCEESYSKLENEQLKKQVEELQFMVKDVMKSNNQLQQELIKQANEPKVIHNTTNNINNTINNFNMLNFLNTNCKDAMNLTDFIDTLNFTFNQLEDTAKYGYLHGIESTFLRGIKNLDVSERPIHCTDTKRMSFYMKDNNEWCKEDSMTKISRALDRIVDKQFNCLQEWKHANPDWENNTAKNNTCIDIMSQITQGHLEPDGSKFQKKVHRMLATSCKFDKFNIE
jgi:hypothetical protein